MVFVAGYADYAIATLAFGFDAWSAAFAVCPEAGARPKVMKDKQRIGLTALNL
jgi:hypothetical protein